MMMDDTNQKVVFKDEKTQVLLNNPVQDPNGTKDEDKKFLEMLLEMVGSAEIDLYKPASLINKELYSKLTVEVQGNVDMEAINMLSAIRDIKDLWDAGFKDSFQINNLVSRLRNTKERLEEEGGDLFII